MSSKVKTLEELKDSQIMFDKELPPFGYMLVCIVSLLLIGVFVWSLFAHKAYIIHAEGVITSSDSNYVMSSYTGEIKESFMKEGKLVSEGDVLFTVKSTDYDLQEEQLKSSKENFENQIAQYDKLVLSIQDNENYFDAANSEDALYYSIYENYKSQITQNVIDISTYKAYGYTDGQIEAELVKIEGKKSEIYYSTLQSVENTRQEIMNQLETVTAQLSAIGNGKEEYEVKATSTGVLHILSDYKKGMVVQTAAPIATITPEDANTIIEAYVSTADMARLHVGDEVQIEVNGLSQTIYGNISGTVNRIDSNLTTMDSGKEGNTQVFKISIIPETEYLVSKSGEKVNIVNGMTVEARVIYDKMTYFDYILDKLGVKYR